MTPTHSIPWRTVRDRAAQALAIIGVTLLLVAAWWALFGPDPQSVAP